MDFYSWWASNRNRLLPSWAIEGSPNARIVENIAREAWDAARKHEQHSR